MEGGIRAGLMERVDGLGEAGMGLRVLGQVMERMGWELGFRLGKFRFLFSISKFDQFSTKNSKK